MTTTNTDQNTTANAQQTPKNNWIMPAIAGFSPLTTIALGTFALVASNGADTEATAAVELSTTTTSTTMVATPFVDTDDADTDTPSPIVAGTDGASEKAAETEQTTPTTEPIETTPEPESPAPEPVVPQTDPVAVTIPKGLLPKLQVPDSILLDDNNKGVITVHNGGALDLTVTFIGSDFPGVDFYGVIGTVSGGETKAFDVVIDEEALPFGDYTIDVLVQSTAGDRLVKVHGTKTITVFDFGPIIDFPPDGFYL